MKGTYTNRNKKTHTVRRVCSCWSRSRALQWCVHHPRHTSSQPGKRITIIVHPPLSAPLAARFGRGRPCSASARGRVATRGGRALRGYEDTFVSGVVVTLLCGTPFGFHRQIEKPVGLSEMLLSVLTNGGHQVSTQSLSTMVVVDRNPFDKQTTHPLRQRTL